MVAQPNDVRANEDERVVTDPAVLGGRPIVRGTRIPVSLILNLVAYGYSLERVIQAYPVLTLEDVKAALLYAGELMDGPRSHALVG